MIRLLNTVCALVAVQSIVFALVVSEVFQIGDVWEGAIFFTGLASSGPLGCVLTLFLEPYVPHWIYPPLLVAVTLAQWFVLWRVGVRALSARGRVSWFWIALYAGVVLGVCWLSEFVHILILIGRYGA